MSMPIRVVVLNELTLAATLIAALRGRAPLVFDVTPLLPIPGGPFQRACGWLMRRLRLRTVAEAYPDIAHDLAEYIPSRQGYYLPNEEWLMAKFDLDRSDGASDEALRAARHETLNLFYQRIALIYTLDRLNARLDALEVWGVDSITLSFIAQVLGGKPLVARFIPPAGRLANLPFAIAIAAVTTLQIARWVRLGRSQPQHKALGVDWVYGGGQVRHNGIARELAEDENDIVWVFRSRAAAHKGLADCQARHWCTIGDGAMSPGEAISSLAWAMGCLVRSWLRFGGLDWSVAWRLFVLPQRQLEWRALFNLYRFDHFWGRDDYNVQHMLRTWECRRVGTVSLGISHGIMAANIVEPMVRFTDFDIFYVLGMDIYQRYNKATWSPRMQVRPIGPWGMDRGQLARLNLPRPANILVFATPHIDRPEYLAATFEIARAFPDRKVLLRFKPGETKAVHYPRYVEMLADAPSNLSISELDTYELFLHASYSVGTLSTTTAEAVAYGLASFYLDVDDTTRIVHYRSYPAMRTTSAADVIARIRSIEDGSWRYPREEMADLIDLSGLIPYDAIRVDMGLGPRQVRHPMLPPDWQAGNPPAPSIQTPETVP